MNGDEQDRPVPEGWVKLWRKIMVHEVWTEMPESCLKVFLFCLMTATRQPITTEYNGYRVSVPAGGLVSSTRDIAAATNLGHQQVRNTLERLFATHLISVKATQHYTVIKVTKWETYQSSPVKGNTLETGGGNTLKREKQHTDPPQRTHCYTDARAVSEEGEKVEEKNKPPGVPLVRKPASPNGRGSAPDPPPGAILVISPEQAQADDAYAEFLQIYTGTVTDRTRRAWDRIMTGHPELVALCLSNTPDWMRTKRYGDGVVTAATYLREGAWRSAPPTALTRQRTNSSKGTDWELVAQLATGRKI